MSGVKVVIADGHVVYVDGVSCGAGMEVEVSAAAAKALVESGKAEKA